MDRADCDTVIVQSRGAVSMLVTTGCYNVGVGARSVMDLSLLTSCFDFQQFFYIDIGGLQSQLGCFRAIQRQAHRHLSLQINDSEARCGLPVPHYHQEEEERICTAARAVPVQAICPRRKFPTTTPPNITSQHSNVWPAR